MNYYFQKSMEMLFNNDNKCLTENGAISNATTFNNNLDYFAKMIRGINEVNSIRLFSNAYDEDKLLALKNLFHARDIRGGSGERTIFRTQMKWLIENHPLVAQYNMKHIYTYGRWDDIIVCFMGTELEKTMLDLICNQLETDIINKKEEKGTSLLAKWLPSENSSLDRSLKGAFRKIANNMNISYKDLRKVYITPLRNYIDIVETKMSGKRWEEINLEHVPSQAMKHLKNAFEKNCPQWDEYVENLGNNKAKINTSTLNPHEIVGEYLKTIHGGSYGYGYSHNNETCIINPILEKQWENMVDDVKKMGSLGKSIVMSDTSGSMMGDDAIKVSLALGLIISKCTSEAFKNLIITFETQSHFVRVPDETLLSSLQFLTNSEKFPWGGTTNFQCAFDNILKHAREYVYPDKTVGLKQEDMPEKLFVISDMQFNATSNKYSSNYEKIKRKYHKYGYKIPQIIFWNVRANTKDFPVTIRDDNTALISGFSTSILKSVLEGSDISPLGVMLRTLENERYDAISLPENLEQLDLGNVD